jgi:signal transduction histidine kinase
MNPKDDIEYRLQQELKKNESDRDYGTIIKLSHELTELSEADVVRFTTDAGIINRLGKELVARQETAVVELIKNAYDADATRVELIFTNTSKPGGTLEIIDNGTGMNREELINGFMRLSSKNKVVNPTSPKYKRTRAGKKGIGRFATQRLGTILEIYSQPENENIGSYVNINWSDFTPGLELILVENEVKEIALPTHGTRLVISDLYEKWSDADIKRVFRYVSDILQPFPISLKAKNKKSDPGFNVHLFKSDQADLELVADEQSQILEYALGVVNGEVDSNGSGTYSIESMMYDVDKKNIDYVLEGEKVNFDDLKSVRFRAYYFTQPQDEEVYPKNLKTHINRILREKGGVRVYRNGFRVPPYGSKQDDWIGLAESTAKRKVLPPHSNSNWIGIVELSDSNGQVFEEKSSREGLIEGNAFQELKVFLYKALTDTAVQIAVAREKKITAGQKDWKTSTSQNNPATAIKEVASELDDIFRLEKKNRGKYESEKDRKFNQKRKETLLKQLARIAYKLIDENAMLRVLASTGITVSEFIHEIHQTIGSIDANVHHIKLLSRDIKGIDEYINGLTSNTDRFVSYISYFNQAIRENIVRELKAIEIGEVVHRFVTSTQPLAKQRGIDINCSVKGFDLFTTQMHESEWTSILSNLYSNSVKAIERADVIGKIFIEVYPAKNELVVEFSDNGDGISKNIVGDIFDPFVTISSLNREDNFSNDQSGLGLGLKIVRDIMTSYGGSIIIGEQKLNYSTTFVLKIPKLAQ